MPPPRLYVRDGLAADAVVTLDRPRAHHLVTVLRAQTGDTVRLFNGHDGEWAATLRAADRKACTLDVTERTRPQVDPPPLTLLFAPLKKGRSEWVAEKAVELGVTHLWPVRTARAVADRVNTDKLAANAVAAAEQCGRLDVPRVAPVADLTATLDGWRADAPLWLADAGGTAAGGLPPGDGRPEGVLVGPEGGLSASELDAVRAFPFVGRLDLGPRTLRADTAVVAALTCWQARRGDWRRAADDETDTLDGPGP